MSHLILYLNQVLLALLELLRNQQAAPSEKLTTGARAVEVFLSDLQSSAEISGFEWTLELMAEHCGMGRSAFSNYCLQLTNTSPMNYLSHCRLSHAAHMLKNNLTISITDLALDLGFANSQYFSRCFKKQFGTPPLKWRKRQNTG